jgi:hypothetical protein
MNFCHWPDSHDESPARDERQSPGDYVPGDRRDHALHLHPGSFTVGAYLDRAGAGGGRYTQEEQRSQGYTPTQSFWPKRQEIAVALAGVTATTLMAVPFAILLTMIWLMPAGDDWPLVIARLACLGTWFALSFAWWRKIRATFRDRFRHVFPQESLEKVHAYWNADKSPTRIQSICGCLTWLTIGILAVLIAVNVIDLNGFQMGNAPRKLRGLAVIINWCQGNPNFTRSSMVIASIISVALSAQYARAAITSKQLWRTTP